MKNSSSIGEIIKEARTLHPDISDDVADKLSKFLASELNKDELNNVSLKRVTGEFLAALLKPQKSEN